MSVTDYAPADLLAAVRMVLPVGKDRDVDRAVERAERTSDQVADVLDELTDALATSTPATTGRLVGDLFDGTVTAADVVARAAMPILDTDTTTRLLAEAEQRGRQRAAGAVEAVLDVLPRGYADAALAGPYAAWVKASDKLAGLLKRHGVRPDADAVVEAPAEVGTAWRNAGETARLALTLADAVAVVEQDVTHGPVTDNRNGTAWTHRWWTPDPERHPDPVARRAAAAGWDPSPSGGPVQLLPTRAAAEGWTFGLVSYVDDRHRRMTWTRCAEAATQLQAAAQRGLAYGRPAREYLQPHQADLVARCRALDDGLPSTTASAAA